MLTVLIGVTVLDAGAVLSDLAQLSLLGSAADGDTITQVQAEARGSQRCSAAPHQGSSSIAAIAQARSSGLVGSGDIRR